MALDTPPHTTHEVVNQPPPFLGVNAFDADPALQEALAREGGAWGVDRARDLGALTLSEEADEHRRRAQRNVPVLHQHDRFGHRVDAVEYDPSMLWMLRQGIERELSSLPWRDPQPGAHVVRAALFYMFNGLDTGPVLPDVDQLRGHADAAPRRPGDRRGVRAADHAARLRPLRAGRHGDDREAGRLGPPRQHDGGRAGRRRLVRA